MLQHQRKLFNCNIKFLFLSHFHDRLFFLDTLSNPENSIIQVIDMNGITISNQNFSNLENGVMNISNMTTGMYLLKCIDGNNIQTIKFVKE